MSVKTYSLDFTGKKLSVEIGKLAGQANGSCRIQYGDTTVLVTATMGREAKNIDYFPLSVDYEEKYYAAGKIKGSKWIKREGRPSEEAILSGRLIDRTLRPRFDHGMRNEVQVVATVLSFDGVNDPDMVALFGASLALMVSDIPFNGPVAGVRVGRRDGKLILNPTYEDRETGDFDLVVSGTAEKINMIEAGANIVPEADIVAAAEHGLKNLRELTEFQKMIASEIGKAKQEVLVFAHDEELKKEVFGVAVPLLEEALYTPDKLAYVEGLNRVRDAVKEHVITKYQGDPDAAKKVDESVDLFDEAVNYVVHKNILESEKRPDGRKIDELREISAEVGVLPQVHGSGLFNRGSTQALSVLTLAAPGLEHWVETMEIDLTKKRFMHHYVFPPFSVGETGRLGAPGRREIGHGALAERSLKPIIPSKDEFPYTIRVVSEILSSNGSSSMASVCGSSLALMDGGVHIKTPAAGIAMGLMFESLSPKSSEGRAMKYKILTDIQGPEDHHGDMDLKVAGTKDGVTGMQMDVKVDGITTEILGHALEQAKKARLGILEHMNRALASPRAELSPHAPRVQTIKINPSKIGALIGPGGKIINEIIEKTGTSIDIEDDGTVFVTSPTPEGMEKARALIAEVTYEVKPGDEFDGTVVRLMDFGAFVEFLPGRDGMVHVSEISGEHVNRPSDILKVGQKVHVWVREIDSQGRINLTMLDPSQPHTRSPRPERREYSSGRPRHGGGSRRS